jgi:hypothetical protein
LRCGCWFLACGLRRLLRLVAAGLYFLGRQYRVQRIAFLPRTKLHDAVRLDVFDQTLQNLSSETRARHFATAKENRRLDLVSLIQKTQNVVLLGLVIVVIHIDAELDLFDRDRLLVLLGLALLLFLLVQIFPVIHDAAYGWLGGGRNLNQIQILGSRHFKRFERRHDSNLPAFVVNHANFTRPDTVIGADKTFFDAVLRALNDWG